MPTPEAPPQQPTDTSSADGERADAARRAEQILDRHLLTEGMMPLVLDVERSRGTTLIDQRTGEQYIDLFGFYASSPLGMNPPQLEGDDAFLERLHRAALNKVTNSDVRTPLLGRFVETFSRVGMPEYLPYAFFISGGALAVENALKAAFDWKVRKNFQQGYRREVGHQVLHLDQAFHGRTGYTLSLTDTPDPVKTKYFPKFDWPRITNPALRFPVTEEEKARVREHEAQALQQAERYFHEREDEIAAVLLEPIQGEGGDNHFRPPFLKNLKALAHDHDALLVFDEVQSGVGITGAFWAHQALGVRPDLLAFGKKSQVCGVLAGEKLGEVDDHVFEVPSRLNSTWGGNIVDMVRFDRILEVIEEDDLLGHAADVGAHLLEELQALASDYDAVTNPRGRGLMCAFDVPTPDTQARLKELCFDEGVILLGCGTRSIRFRPPLTITRAELDDGLAALRRALDRIA